MTQQSLLLLLERVSLHSFTLVVISFLPFFLPLIPKFSDSDDIISDVSSDTSAFTLSPASCPKRTPPPGPRGILKWPMAAQLGCDIIRRARSAEPLDQSRLGDGNRCVAGSLDRGGNRGNQEISRSLERGEQKVMHVSAPPRVSPGLRLF